MLDALPPRRCRDRNVRPAPSCADPMRVSRGRGPSLTRHFYAEPVPSRRTARGDSPDQPASWRHPHTSTHDVPLSTDLVHISTSIIADRLCEPRNPPAHTLVYVYNGGVRSPLLARVSLTPHTGLHSRTVLQAPSVGPIYSGKSEQYTTPLTSALAHAQDRPAPHPLGDTTARAPLSLPFPACHRPRAGLTVGRGVAPRRGTRSPRRLHPRGCNAPG